MPMKTAVDLRSNQIAMELPSPHIHITVMGCVDIVTPWQFGWTVGPLQFS